MQIAGFLSQEESAALASGQWVGFLLLPSCAPSLGGSYRHKARDAAEHHLLHRMAPQPELSGPGQWS